MKTEKKETKKDKKEADQTDVKVNNLYNQITVSLSTSGLGVAELLFVLELVKKQLIDYSEKLFFVPNSNGEFNGN